MLEHNRLTPIEWTYSWMLPIAFLLDLLLLTLCIVITCYTDGHGVDGTFAILGMIATGCAVLPVGITLLEECDSRMIKRRKERVFLTRPLRKGKPPVISYVSDDGEVVVSAVEASARDHPAMLPFISKYESVHERSVRYFDADTESEDAIDYKMKLMEQHALPPAASTKTAKKLVKTLNR